MSGFEDLSLTELREILRAQVVHVAERYVGPIMHASSEICEAEPRHAALALVVSACGLAKVHGAGREEWLTMAAEVWEGVHVEVLPVGKGGDT